MWQVPLSDTSFGPNEIEAVAAVMRSGWLSQGEKVAEFEQKFAQFIGVEHAVAVVNGTAALHLGNLALGIGPGDEVLCPALTFVAGPNSILYTGARPVFVDIIGPHDLNMSPEDIERKITPATKAIQIVHYAGQPCRMDQIMDIAHRHKLPVIEDSSHAPGAEFQGIKCGGIGALGCFSFFPNKNMTTGEGGMVTTNDAALAAKVRLLRCHAMSSVTHQRHAGGALTYDILDLGYNYRMDEMHAALGIVQLSRLPEFNRQRAEVAAYYRKHLKHVEIPFLDSPGTSVHHILPVLLRPGIDRKTFMIEMRDRGIQTSIHYPSSPSFAFYQQKLFALDDLPHTVDATAREVTLPLYPHMGEDKIDLVCRAVDDIHRKMGWL